MVNERKDEELHVLARAGGDGYPTRTYCGLSGSPYTNHPNWIWPAAIRDRNVHKACLTKMAACFARTET